MKGPPPVIAEERRARFHDRIFSFYAENARSFPWRHTTDRYAVMVSEVMLQQTQAERVVQKYEAWLERFPDVQSLAAAPLREVLAHWSGLGYNSRGQRLQLCARTILERFGGQVPGEPRLLKSLPGIGAYTSRSIPAFADNLDVAAVDTNIRRIIIHEFSLPEESTTAAIQAVADQLLAKGRSREWHNALMDYGSLVLTGRRTGIRSLSRQSKFEGSKRWYRGRLLKELIASGEAPLDELLLRYGECPYDIGAIIGEMQGEGLLEELPASSGQGRVLRIREG